MNIVEENSSAFPLHDAVATGNFSLVQRLLRIGYDVNEMHYDRVTPMHMAGLSGNVEILKFLIENGAWINAQSIDNSTPLCEASAGGNALCVKLLLAAGALVNPPLLHSTPLHEASLRGNSDIISILLAAGAKVNANDLHYGTPLHAVCSMIKPDLVSIKLLIQFGARVNAIKNHKTPLHLLAQNSASVDAALVLLLHGSNVYLRDGFGNRPRDLCKKNSDLWQLLAYCEQHPRSLSECCRLSLWKHYGPFGIQELRKLPIPSLIIGYLM